MKTTQNRNTTNNFYSYFSHFYFLFLRGRGDQAVSSTTLTDAFLYRILAWWGHLMKGTSITTKRITLSWQMGVGILAQEVNFQNLRRLYTKHLLAFVSHTTVTTKTKIHMISCSLFDRFPLNNSTHLRDRIPQFVEFDILLFFYLKN